jgi:hypothetical protein
LILAPVKCSLQSVFGSIKAKIGVAHIGRVRLGAIESSSLSSKLNGKLYHVSSLSIVALLYTNSSESGGDESSNYPLDKSRPLNKAIKVTIINKID